MFCFTEQNSYFSFPQSQSFRSLKLLFANFSSEVDVLSRRCPSRVKLTIICQVFYCVLRNSRDRAAFKDNLIYKPPFLLYMYAAPRCLAIVTASQWPRELRLWKNSLNTGVSQARKDSSQVRASITAFSQATSAVGGTSTSFGQFSYLCLKKLEGARRSSNLYCPIRKNYELAQKNERECFQV